MPIEAALLFFERRPQALDSILQYSVPRSLVHRVRQPLFDDLVVSDLILKELDPKL